MLTAEENEFITRIGPGTPMGEVFRRFWLPGLLIEELPGPDCTPVRLRLLGEDLLAFRDTDGRVGIVDVYCPHRNAPLFFGRNEESGLRCIYHGWKFDVDGNCTDMPNCEEGETYKQRLKIVHYPAFEGGGMVWVYMGPQDKIPPRPAYEFLDVPDDHTYVNKFFLNCNYLQILENQFGEGHASFLHSEIATSSNGGAVKAISGEDKPPARVRGRASRVTYIPTDFGHVLATRGDDTPDGKEVYTVAGPFWMPCFQAAGPAAPGVMSFNIKVPVDDENSVFFRYKWSERPLESKALYEMQAGGAEYPELAPGTYWPKQNKSNDYEIDRVKQRFFNYSGLINTPVQDVAILEDQRGPISNRTRENLVSTDKIIVQARERLAEVARALVDGVEPSEPWNPEAYRFRPGRIEVEPGTPVEEAVQPLLKPRPHKNYATATGSPTN